jgi:hypothetical protein
MMRLIAAAALLSPLLCAQQYIEWRTNYRQALKEAAATQKPLFLEFRCEA